MNTNEVFEITSANYIISPRINKLTLFYKHIKKGPFRHLSFDSHLFICCINCTLLARQLPACQLISAAFDKLFSPTLYSAPRHATRNALQKAPHINRPSAKTTRHDKTINTSPLSTHPSHYMCLCVWLRYVTSTCVTFAHAW